MIAIQLEHFADQVYAALKATFSDLISTRPADSVP